MSETSVNEVTPAPLLPTARPVSAEERRRLVAESLRVGNPAGHAIELPSQADPRQDCPIELPVEAIRAYEHNPRRSANARFDDIKASIRACGIRNPLTVTRRPGEDHFIVEAGGNTRLLALQQLWAETRDPRFARLTVLFRPWRGESHVLGAHLIENDQRGEMSFWDKARGVVALKQQLEAELARTTSLRQLEEALRERGLAVNTATLSHSLFAVERLTTLGEAVTGLSGLDVKTLQPRLNALKRIAQARASLSEDEIYAALFEPVFRRAADEFRQTGAYSIARIADACEAALAERLGDAPAEPAEDPGDIAPVGTANTADEAIAPSAPPIAERSSRASRQAGLRLLCGQVSRFAALGGVSDVVRFHGAAPLGYFMEALPDSGGTGTASRRRAWWLLAAVAGQLDHPAPASATPVTQNAYRVGASEDLGADAAPALDAAFVGWLIDPGDPAAAAFWDIVALARELGAVPRAAPPSPAEPG